MAKLNCWEIENCGRQPGGEKVGEFGVCPAAIEKHFDQKNNGKNGGRICWLVAGTFCKGEKQGDFAEKVLSCMNCDVYKKIKEEEGSDFKITLSGV